MGAPKGKPHRKFTQAEKLAYISEFQDAHISQSKFAKEHRLNLSMFERWMKEYAEQGEAGLASHRDRCDNRYAALHTSKTLDEMGQLQLRMAKLESDVARLKKGYRVKGSGSQKEFVTGRQEFQIIEDLRSKYPVKLGCLYGKLTMEGAFALPLAAILEGKCVRTNNTVLICSGGNIDQTLFEKCLAVEL